MLKNGKELMVTVDGRYYYASGMTIPEFALFMQGLGCKSAINLGMPMGLGAAVFKRD